MLPPGGIIWKQIYPDQRNFNLDIREYVGDGLVFILVLTSMVLNRLFLHHFQRDKNKLECLMVGRQFIKAAIHRSGNSSKRQFIEAAMHRSGNSSKRHSMNGHPLVRQFIEPT
jgi:hypothetical protein